MARHRITPDVLARLGALLLTVLTVLLFSQAQSPAATADARGGESGCKAGSLSHEVLWDAPNPPDPADCPDVPETPDPLRDSRPYSRPTAHAPHTSGRSSPALIGDIDAVGSRNVLRPRAADGCHHGPHGRGAAPRHAALQVFRL
ncbi:hypothetical protein [Streptomyces sp. KR80]|uniref:hypothetical protein n=1 Tax=Streptomyces sp. KR80 TaxID=3457426 RepID=UPI003FD401F4